MRALIVLAMLLPIGAAAQVDPGVDQAPSAIEIGVAVDRSAVIDSLSPIDRVSVANGKIAEAVVLSPREVIVNGKAPGNTSLIVWQSGGKRTIYLLRVRPDDTGLIGVRRELHDELAGQSIEIELENGIPFLRGTAKNLGSADRAVAIASALGKPVNLLRVDVPGDGAADSAACQIRDDRPFRSAPNSASTFSAPALETPPAA
jgi:pilus assembly protein CpaC